MARPSETSSARLVLDTDTLDRGDFDALEGDDEFSSSTTGNQVSPQAADRDRPIQVPASFADDIATQPVLEPDRLRHDDSGRHDGDNGCQHQDERMS